MPQTFAASCYKLARHDILAKHSEYLETFPRSTCTKQTIHLQRPCTMRKCIFNPFAPTLAPTYCMPSKPASLPALPAQCQSVVVRPQELVAMPSKTAETHTHTTILASMQQASKSPQKGLIHALRKLHAGNPDQHATQNSLRIEPCASYIALSLAQVHRHPQKVSYGMVASTQGLVQPHTNI